MEEILETTKFVVEQSRHVRIDQQNLARFTSGILANRSPIPPWDCHYHFCEHSETMASYLLVLDTLNFCFWPLPGEKRWEIPWCSKTISGYFALAAALKKALTSDRSVLEPGYLANLTVETLATILGGKGNLPLMEKRTENVNALGTLLLARYDGKIIHLLEEAGRSAVAIARLLADQLESFQDVARYKNKTICFYKRAQIFASDLYGAFQGRSWGNLSDIDRLTAFADYKLPQVLRHAGILKYSPELAERVDNLVLLPQGSPEEVEIRANTIWAVERIREDLKTHGRRMTASEIDWTLWTMGQNDRYRAKPYHRTLTIFY